LALKGAGVACVVAESFARIFFRNAINLGLPILVCPDAVQASKGGEIIGVNTEQGVIRVGDGVFPIEPYPPFLQELIEAGGLVDWVREQIHRRNQNHE
jgi:3-isopropylmalate/(R)-2-methylmalate dehydratase small subunit